VSFATDQLAVDLFFGLTAGRTARELAALLARQESSVSESLQDHDDRDRLVSLESAMRGVEGLAREYPVVWITLASIDDGDSRPRTDDVAP
jgi:FPC/CPF motif-containing protein YcgG